MSKVLLGLSGGVDSATALILLKEAGYDVETVFMQNWDSVLNNDIKGNPTINEEKCAQTLDFEDAQKISKKLNVEIIKVDFIKEYWNKVFSYFLTEYEKGRTPNPDILCNNEIKFKSFLEYALTKEADYIAMGHYARKEEIDGVSHLLRGKDNNKDQSYFLSQLTSEQLKKVIFPIGDLTKEEVRELAKKHDLDVYNKKDSTGICFIGERDFGEFLSNYILTKKGPMKTIEGKIIKEHEGLFYYTIGQRKGLDIGGLKGYDQAPWFVIGKDIKENTLYIGQGYHNDYLYSNKCIVKDVVFRGDRDLENRSFTAKFRYRSKDVDVNLKWLDETTLEVSYPNKERAVTPGQAAAFYEGEVCVAGGFIDEVYNNEKRRKY